MTDILIIYAYFLTIILLALPREIKRLKDPKLGYDLEMYVVGSQAEALSYSSPWGV